MSSCASLLKRVRQSSLLPHSSPPVRTEQSNTDVVRHESVCEVTANRKLCTNIRYNLVKDLLKQLRRFFVTLPLQIPVPGARKDSQGQEVGFAKSLKKKDGARGAPAGGAVFRCVASA